MTDPYETKPQISEDQTSLSSFIWELVKILVIALAIIVPIRLYVGEPFIVSGSSMLPNFHDREYLVINKISYRFAEPERGDVVVLKYPKNPEEYFIKRIIGVPGDTISIDKGSVTITNSEYPDGKVLNETYLSAGVITIPGAGTPVTLKNDEYFVMGDNRGASSDSRAWGILPREDIVGKVFVRILPVTKFSLFTFESPLQ